MFQNAEKFMKELQEKQAIYPRPPRPETPRLCGPNCMVKTGGFEGIVLRFQLPAFPGRNYSVSPRPSAGIPLSQWLSTACARFCPAQLPIILQHLPDSAFDDVGLLFYLEG
jgi:hypothetical protein